MSISLEPFSLSEALCFYKNHSNDSHQSASAQKMLEFYEEKGDEAFLRSCEQGHFTASAWILNPSHTAALLMHHRKLGRWLQPGGHADGDKNLLQVALKEVEEETGLRVRPLFKEPFDVDIHLIPQYKDILPHSHYDVRFVFEAPHEHYQSNSESFDLKWVPLAELGAYVVDPSVERMYRKTWSPKNEFVLF